jgi:histidine triad (HIT) family protein
MMAGEIPVEPVHESEHVLVIRDIKPQAPQHFLILTRRHIPTANDLRPGDAPVISDMYQAAAAVAQRLGFAESGYRTVLNCNRDGGQEVFHLHMHLLGGRVLGWPPG